MRRQGWNVLAIAISGLVGIVGCGESRPPASPAPVIASGDAAVHTGDACGPLTISSVTATPNRLWPPNHKFVPVTVTVAASSTCGGVSCSITSVSSDEPVNGRGDGNTAPDWQITGSLQAQLRAERSGTGDGRVYTLNVRCTDAAGHSATSSTVVTVPHDQRK